MYLIITFIIVTVLCYLATVKTKFDHPAPFVLMALSAIALFISLILLPLCRNDDKSFMVKVQSYRKTIATQRQLSEIERAALVKDILEINATMADRQYWSKSKWVSVYYHSCIDTLKPLE